jgi:hypothetical protein
MRNTKNWKVRYYDENCNLITFIIIKDRIEYEAEKEATNQMPYNCDDWTMKQIYGVK